VTALFLLALLSQEQKALAYLEIEVPRWSAENQCYSCHNNGDAARALIKAGRQMPLQDTLAWLSEPGRWERNRGHPASSDKKLARAQFTVALSAAVAAELAPVAVLKIAAAQLIKDQDPDGAWRAEGGESQLGSPVTWGTALTTLLAAEAIERAGESAAAAKARNWLANFPPKSHMELAVAVMAGRTTFTVKLRQGQNGDGGFGPYPGSPSEPFDTALALLALKTNPRARDYLIRTQLADGGWPETTRPAGGQTYAQHISTSGWATFALLSTRP
jgi:hypothetical protein